MDVSSLFYQVIILIILRTQRIEDDVVAYRGIATHTHIYIYIYIYFFFWGGRGLYKSWNFFILDNISDLSESATETK